MDTAAAFFSPWNGPGITLWRLIFRHRWSWFGHTATLYGHPLAACRGAGLRTRGCQVRVLGEVTEGLSMVVSTLRRSFHIVALTMCSAMIAVTATPASARPHHGSGHHAHRSHRGHHYARYHHHRRSVARMSRWERGVAQMQAGGFNNAQASVMMPGTASAGMASSGGFGGDSSVVSAARSFIGG